MKLYQVDSFTDRIFKGNPAGVCILEKRFDDETLMNIAAEMSLSETAFLLEKEDGYSLRWFTPEAEVNLCGHGTLAASHILWEKGMADMDAELIFHTLSGILKAKKINGRIELDFPRNFVSETGESDLINNAFNIKPLYTGKNDLYYLIELENEKAVLDLDPDFNALLKADRDEFILTAGSDNPDYDFVSRFFAPGIGVNEDPVTGSAHTHLAPYWAEKLGKNKLTGLQASKRSGIVECELGPENRVYLRGNAVTFFETDITIE